jgi:hypothetical protein
MNDSQKIFPIVQVAKMCSRQRLIEMPFCCLHKQARPVLLIIPFKFGWYG